MSDKNVTKVEEKRSFKERAKETGKKIWNGCKENKAMIAAIAPPLIAGGFTIISILAKKGQVNEERRLKENFIYDRSAGHYVESKRKLTGQDWIHIDHRHKNDGESYSEILEDMHLLK